jgi:uncharacterized transporter YbjL
MVKRFGPKPSSSVVSSKTYFSGKSAGQKKLPHTLSPSTRTVINIDNSFQCGKIISVSSVGKLVSKVDQIKDKHEKANIVTLLSEKEKKVRCNRNKKEIFEHDKTVREENLISENVKRFCKECKNESMIYTPSTQKKTSNK